MSPWRRPREHSQWIEVEAAPDVDPKAEVERGGAEAGTEPAEVLESVPS